MHFMTVALNKFFALQHEGRLAQVDGRCNFDPEHLPQPASGCARFGKEWRVEHRFRHAGEGARQTSHNVAGFEGTSKGHRRIER